jgi:hypothetical protein
MKSGEINQTSDKPFFWRSAKRLGVIMDAQPILGRVPGTGKSGATAMAYPRATHEVHDAMRKNASFRPGVRSVIDQHDQSHRGGAALRAREKASPKTSSSD